MVLVVVLLIQDGARRLIDMELSIFTKGCAGGGWYNQKGNRANYLCLPKDPQYFNTTVPTWQSYLYEAEYESNNRIFGKTTHDYNVFCAVCHVSRKSDKIVIPTKVSCPKSWTRE